MKKMFKPLAGAIGGLGVLVASAGQVLAATEIKQPGAFFPDIGSLINKILTIVLALGALMVFLYLIWGGIDWITSGGDKSKTEKARDKITAAIIGLIILAASWAILSLALSFLGAGSLNDVLKSAGL